MRHSKFTVEIYDWDVHLVEADSPKDKKKVIDLLEDFGVDPDMIEEIGDNVNKGVTDGGWHFYNTGNRASMIFLYESSNPIDRVNNICHEKRHMEDRMLRTLGINDIEAAGYLAGYLGQKLI